MRPSLRRLELESGFLPALFFFCCVLVGSVSSLGAILKRSRIYFLLRLSSLGRALLLTSSPTSVQGDPLLCALALAPAPPLASECRPPLLSHSQVRRRCFVGACAPSTHRPHASPEAQTQASHTAPPLLHIPGANLGAASSAARAQLRPSRQPRRSSSHYESFALLSTTPLRRARGSSRLHLRRLAIFTIGALNRR